MQFFSFGKLGRRGASLFARPEARGVAPNVSKAILAAFAVVLALGEAAAQEMGDPPQRAAPVRKSRRALKETSGCQLSSGGESAVLAVLGPLTLRLADGRFVRLSEVFVPPKALPSSGYDPSAAAADYLKKTALGQRVEVKFGGTQRDRYGVYLGHVFVKGEHETWLQEGLVSAGLAEAYPQPDNRDCAPKLAAAEAQARDAGRGYWGLALFKVLPGKDARAILNLVQTYQIVEGSVVSAAESGGRITLSFGPEAKRDFAAILEPAVKKKFSNKKDAASWKGATLRIRGWIDRKRGPLISVTQPEQVEIISENAAERASAGQDISPQPHREH